MNLQLFDTTHELIREQLAALTNPCVACSFGKDSMVMLHMLLQHNPAIPVIYVEQFPSKHKHDFAKRMMTEWKLNMHLVAPAWRTVYGKAGHVELVTGYELGPKAYLAIPTEPIIDLEEETALCGVDALHAITSAPPSLQFDGVFIGHRNDDKDVVLGDIPLNNNQAVIVTEGFRYIYPLKDWTSADVWNYHRRFEVPANEGRYGRKDPEFNNDVWNLCTRCLAQDGWVRCPKERDEVPAFGGLVDWEGVSADIRNNAINLENQ